jgi:hypothetical protein
MLQVVCKAGPAGSISLFSVCFFPFSFCLFYGPKLLVAQVFRKFDLDLQGSISRSEFVRGLSNQVA